MLRAHRESTSEDIEDVEVVEDIQNQDTFDDRHIHHVAEPSTSLLGRQKIEGELYRSETLSSAQPTPDSHSSPPHHADTTPREVLAPRDLTSQQAPDDFFCSRCNIHLSIAEQAEHVDYHFALDLSKEMRQETRGTRLHAQTTRNVPTGSKPPRGRGRTMGMNTGRAGVEKGQAKLAFGRRI